MTRIIVAGGRDFDDYEYLCKELDGILDQIDGDKEIVSGTAKGADSLGTRYGKEHGIPVKEFKPNWRQYGRAAGIIRNQEMLDYASEETPLVVAFWDGQSKGTHDMIRKATHSHAELKVFRYGGE